jgi:hypothetical protein
MPFSRRERGDACQKSTYLVREAVGCNGVFGGNAVSYPFRTCG